MFRKVITPIFLLALLMVIGSVIAGAQTASLGGRISSKDAAGKETPIVGSQEDCPFHTLDP